MARILEGSELLFWHAGIVEQPIARIFKNGWSWARLRVQHVSTQHAREWDRCVCVCVCVCQSRIVLRAIVIESMRRGQCDIDEKSYRMAPGCGSPPTADLIDSGSGLAGAVEEMPL
jgi:hypothetical protein